MGKNRVFINEYDVVEIIVNGDQTVESVHAMGDDTVRLAHAQLRAGKPVLILDNLLKMGTVPPEARRSVAELVRSNEYDKLAMLGKGTTLRLGANLLLRATGRGEQVRYFEDYTAAIYWLTQDHNHLTER